ncbi:hypothetical protein KR067_001559 [Drosophila pandora]|nr:hypothetical protein KR067_001559 [Drosophila pandora]
MRIDSPMIMCWLVVVVLISLEANVSGRSTQIRRKRLQPYEPGPLVNFVGGGSGARCGSDGQHSQDGKSPQTQQKRPKPGSSAKARASGIAMQAAKEAKRANEDMASAVKIAAEKIKNEYADKATAAAKAAEAVLAGKSQVLDQLDAEVHEAEVVVQEENQELATAETNAQLALKANHQAQQELKMLSVGLKLAKENLETTEQVSNVWAQSVADKQALLEAAQRRVSVLMRQLAEARSDFDKTRNAANNAARAAQDAKQRIEPNNEVRPECERGRHRRAWQEFDKTD